MAINGKYFAKTLTTTGANEDLISKLKTELGITAMSVKKLTLCTSGEVHISVNNNAYSDMYLNSDLVYSVSLNEEDVFVTSLRVLEGSATGLFLAVVYV